MANFEGAFNASIMNTSSDGLQAMVPCDLFSPSSAVVRSKIFAYSILIPVALLGNILTILVIYTNKNMRTTLDYFIINMAISNLLIPVVALPYQIIKTANNSNVWLVDGTTGECLCKVVFLLVDVSPVASIFSLIGMSLKPFRAIVCRCRNESYFFVSSRRRTLLILCIWLMSLTIFSPYFYTFRLHRHNNTTYCVQRWSPAFDQVKAHRTFSAIVLVLVIIIPFFILITLYSAILITLIKCLPLYNPQSSAARSRRNKTIKNTTKMAFTLVLAFGLCWGPYNVFMIFWGFAWDWKPLPSCNWYLIFLCAQFLTYAYSCLCPSIHFLFFNKYKRGMKRLFLRFLYVTSNGS
ncbi:neuropeptide Y receptor type 6-like [Actinia tenebrosa]|uniref:Neuropeptide Y receptor type 6-like n=1 Tax=Actinia tenebrosa TaxID=6105 RepID=A0A6P8HZ63_ACTTE|nr:neuropeptide Y receptor type 6-like [Actinia tenebrosa]